MNDEPSRLTTVAKNVCDLCRCVVCRHVVLEACYCANGHITCQECLLRHAAASEVSFDNVACAVCRDASAWASAGPFMRSLLETVEEGLGSPLALCENVGCTACLPVAKVEDHARRCPFRIIACPHALCDEEVRLCELHEHIASHHKDTITMRAGQPLTMIVTMFGIARPLVVIGPDLKSTVFQIDFTRILGRSGSFDVCQCLVRLCCIASSFNNWTVEISNRDVNAECDVCEVFRSPIPCAECVTTCRSIAHPIVLASCTSLDHLEVTTMEENVVRWWDSPPVRHLRQCIRRTDESLRRPVARRVPHSSLLLLTLRIDAGT